MNRWMVHGGIALLLVVLTLAAAGIAAADGHDDQREDDGVEEATRYVVGLAEGQASAHAHQEGDEFHGGIVTDKSPEVGFLVVEAEDPARFEQKAREDPSVTYVEEDPLKDLLHQYEPNDPLWDDEGLYGARQVNADHVWPDWMGDENANVCVVDTGVRYTHEDLAGDRWLGGYDYWNGDDDPMDDQGHGTHVAGTAAAWIDNGAGIAGVGNVGIYGVKVLNQHGSGYWSDVAKGITWCADNAGEGTVINLSLGGGGSNSAVEDAVEDAWEKGAIVISSAGNSGPCSDCITFPARLPLTVTVTCTTSTESLCWFSSTGDEADLAAPGDDVLSTCYSHDGAYCEKSGTSMSSPHVSGVAALAWSASPCATPQELRDALNETARDVGEDGWDPEYGHGIVDAKALFDDGLCDPLTATPGPDPGMITLEWTLAGFEPATATTVESFEIHRAEDPEASLEHIDTVPGDTTAYTDAGLGDGETWHYKVFAVTSETTLESNLANATTFDVPEAPHDVSAITGPGQGDITVQWHPDAAEHPDPVSSDGDPGTNGTLLTFEDRTGVAPIEVSYRYCYFADTNGKPAYVDTRIDGELVDSFGFFAPSTADGSCDKDDPSTYATRTFTVDEASLDDEVRFEYVNGDWRIYLADIKVDGLIDPDPPIDDGGTPVTGYRVYEVTDDGDTVLKEETTLNKITQTGLPDGATSTYQVAAVNIVGEGPLTSPVQNRTYQAPNVVPHLEASQQPFGPLGTGIHLEWAPAPQPAWAPVDAYKIYRGTSPDAIDTFIADVPADQHAYTDTTPFTDAPRNYYYAIHADNLIDEGPPSPPACTARGATEQTLANTVDPCFEDGLADTSRVPTTHLEPLYEETFDDGHAPGWETSSFETDLWRVGYDCVSPFQGTHHLIFAQRSPDCDYDVGHAIGWIQTPTVDASQHEAVVLEFAHYYEVEPWPMQTDVLRVQASADGGDSWDTVQTWDSRSHTSGAYHNVRLDVSEWGTDELTIRYTMNTMDDQVNAFRGWYVDDVTLLGKALG